MDGLDAVAEAIQSGLDHTCFLGGELNSPQEDKKMLTEKEKEYLKAVIAPFEDRVSHVTRYTYAGGPCLIIGVDGYMDYAALPRLRGWFEGLELDREYTLEELFKEDEDGSDR